MLQKPYIICLVLLVLAIFVLSIYQFSDDQSSSFETVSFDEERKPFQDDIFIPNQGQKFDFVPDESEDIEQDNSFILQHGTEKEATEVDTEEMEVYAETQEPLVVPMSHFSVDDLGKVFPKNASSLKDKILGPLFDAKRDSVKSDKKIMSDKPKVVVVIDDLGVNHRRTKDILDIKAPITSSFLPYGKNLNRYIKKAQEQGHSVMLHMPMEPFGLTNNNPGPDALLVENAPQINQLYLLKAINKFPTLIGVNNHMGSRFTSQREAFEPIAEEIVQRELIFLDSKTSQSSVVEELIKERGGNVYVRDVFIDHYPDAKRIKRALKRIEKIAQRKGYAIAIGHPKKDTIEQLKLWIPSLESKGIELIALDTLHQIKQQ